MLALTTFMIFILIAMYIGSKLLYWLVVFGLAIGNSNAVYDERTKRIILKLAKEDKIWRDVAKTLSLEEKHETL